MWRKFNFFEKSTVNDEKGVTFFNSTEFTSSTSGRGNIILGDNKGMVHVLDRGLNVTSFTAFQKRVNHLQHVTKLNYLVAVGDEGGDAHHDIVKIYNLDRIGGAAAGGESVEQQCFVKAFRIFPKKTSSSSSSTGDSHVESPASGTAAALAASALSNLGSAMFGVATGSASIGIGGVVGVGSGGAGKGLKVNIPPSPVTCLEVNQEFTCIALGLGNGFIVIFQGDLAR